MQQQWFLYLRSKMNDQQNATTIFLMPPCINLFELNKRLPAPHLTQLLSPSLPVTLLPSRDWKPVWLPEQIAALTEMKERESRRFMCHLPLFDARAHTRTHTHSTNREERRSKWTLEPAGRNMRRLIGHLELPITAIRLSQDDMKSCCCQQRTKKNNNKPPHPLQKRKHMRAVKRSAEIAQLFKAARLFWLLTLLSSASHQPKGGQRNKLNTKQIN